MQDVSFRAEIPDKAIVYLDGLDARVFKHLLSKLGSEERVQNAMILEGLLSQTELNGNGLGEKRTREIRKCFPEFVGVSYEDFSKILKTCDEI